MKRDNLGKKLSAPSPFIQNLLDNGYPKQKHQIDRTMKRENYFPFFLMLMLSLTPLLSIETPRILSFWPLLTGVIMGCWWVFVRKEKLKFSRTYNITVIGMAALCLVSVLWSINPYGALEEALAATAILLFSIPLIGLMRAVPISLVRPYFWLFPICIELAAMLSAYELANDMPIYNTIRGHTADDWQTGTAVMNRGVVCVSFGYFVALILISKMQLRERAKITYAAGMTFFVLLMLSFTQSQSAQMAFGVSALVALLFPSRFKLPYKTLWGLMAIFMIITPTIVYGAYALLISDGQNIGWLKDAYAGNRVEVWQFVMDYALNSPIYGFGMEATRFVEYFDHAQIYHHDVTVLHPHNFSIQIWIEFGLVGVAMASVMFANIIRQLSQTPTLMDKRIMTGLFLAVMAVASVGYGMWQSWWMGELIFLIGLYHLSTKGDKSKSETSRS